MPSAIRFFPRELKSHAAIAVQDVVAKKIGRAVVSGDQQIVVAIAIEIAVGQSAAYFGLIEAAADFAGDVAKFSRAAI